MRDGSPMLRCELKECFNQCKAYGKYSEAGEDIPPGTASRYGGSGQVMFTTTAGHSAEAVQQGATYAANRKAATDKAQQSQPSIHKSKHNRKKATGTTPATPKPASPAPAAKKKPKTRKPAKTGGAAAEADQQGTTPAAKPKPEKAKANTPAVPKPKHGRSEDNGTFDAWVKGCPEGRSDLQQPKLEDNETRREFGKHTATGKEAVTRTLPATLVMPSLSGGKDYR